jgi:hypothetical protein
MTTYILKVILCSSVFIIAYKLLLENAKMHVFNRFYLLSSLIVSFIIPAITINVASSIHPFTDSILLDLPIAEENTISQIVSPDNTINYASQISLIVYIFIATILLFRFLINLTKILSKTKSNQIIPFNNSKIVLLTETVAPHSFLNFLFIDSKDYTNGNIEADILLHESAHIQQKHSYDILFIELLQIVFWFNPTIYYYRKAIQLTHEFLADDAVIKATKNIPNYQYLLIDKAINNKRYNITCQFNYSFTKKRILMMTKISSQKNILLRQLTLIPLLALTVFFFSTKSVAQNTNDLQKTTESNVPSNQDGVSQALLNEYATIVNKIKNDKGFPDTRKLTDADKTKLESIFLAMSKAQKGKQVVIFMPEPPPLPKVVPTNEQIETWKDSKIYGLWINEKRISNSDLGNYKNTDFAQVFVSKLATNAINYGKHYYQVNLMTTEHYNTYYKQTIENKNKYNIGVRMLTNQTNNITNPMKASPIAGGLKKIFDMNKDALIYIDKKETNMDAARKINPSEITVFNFWEGGNAINRFGYRGKNGVVEITTRK